MNKFNHPLMQSNFASSDFKNVSDFLKKDNVLTQSKNVSQFEKKWSKWLGVKYSIFLNSGSSANYLSLLALKLLYKDGGEVIVPTLTWVSDIVAVINNGFKPVFADINLNNLCISEKEIKKKLLVKQRPFF